MVAQPKIVGVEDWKDKKRAFRLNFNMRSPQFMEF